jgi:hypothetical protein
MRFPKIKSDEDPAPDQDPLSQYSAPTVRRPVDRGGSPPLDDRAAAPQRTSDTQVGSDFATRQVQRRLRQTGGARVYQQRIGEMARKMDNRQLFLILGALGLALLALLAVRALRRSDTSSGIATGAGTETTADAETDATAGVGLPAVGAIVTADAGSLENGGAASGGASQTAAPAGAGGEGGRTFVVSGTGTSGLFLRADHSTSSQTLATLPDGTKVEVTGPDFQDGSRTWKKVKTDKGEGWVASDFLVAAP